MTSRILGVVREQVLAALFGAGNAMDAYNVAYRIPNLVRDLFAEGAMSSAFVPTFTRHLSTAGKESAWRLANYVINGLIVITGILVILGIVFAEPIVGRVAGAFRRSKYGHQRIRGGAVVFAECSTCTGGIQING